MHRCMNASPVHCYLEFHFKGQTSGAVSIKQEPCPILILNVKIMDIIPASQLVLCYQENLYGIGRRGRVARPGVAICAGVPFFGIRCRFCLGRRNASPTGLDVGISVVGDGLPVPSFCIAKPVHLFSVYDLQSAVADTDQFSVTVGQLCAFATAFHFQDHRA